MKQKPTRSRSGSCARRAPADRRLMEDIGSVAGRLLDTLGETPDGADGAAAHERRTKPQRPALVEQVLDAAAEVETLLVQQSARIAYLENLTLTDELTGLRNRRGFNEELCRALAAANRYGDEGVLVFCDLDDFKSVNDTYGHHVGDFVLRQLARVLEAEVRETDIVARLGGDEFAILMVQTSWRDGFKRAQMLSRVVNRTIITHQAQKICVAASFGVERFGPNDEGANLIARADMAMYVNKRKKASVALGTAAE